jgi:hypothetical protein
MLSSPKAAIKPTTAAVFESLTPSPTKYTYRPSTGLMARLFPVPNSGFAAHFDVNQATWVADALYTSDETNQFTTSRQEGTVAEPK